MWPSNCHASSIFEWRITFHIISPSHSMNLWFHQKQEWISTNSRSFVKARFFTDLRMAAGEPSLLFFLQHKYQELHLRKIVCFRLHWNIFSMTSRQWLWITGLNIAYDIDSTCFESNWTLDLKHSPNEERATCLSCSSISKGSSSRNKLLTLRGWKNWKICWEVFTDKSKGPALNSFLKNVKRCETPREKPRPGLQHLVLRCRAPKRLVRVPSKLQRPPNKFETYPLLPHPTGQEVTTFDVCATFTMRIQLHKGTIKLSAQLEDSLLIHHLVPRSRIQNVRKPSHTMCIMWHPGDIMVNLFTHWTSQQPKRLKAFCLAAGCKCMALSTSCKAKLCWVLPKHPFAILCPSLEKLLALLPPSAEFNKNAVTGIRLHKATLNLSNFDQS